MNFNKSQIKIIDKNFRQFKELQRPKIGWIKFIRQSLLITTEQLAKRLNISSAAVSQFEKSEINNTISLESLQKIAHALNCKLSYQFVPYEKSLEKTLKKQVEKKSAQIIKNVEATMILENQKVKNNRKALIGLQKELLANLNSNIWK